MTSSMVRTTRLIGLTLVALAFVGCASMKVGSYTSNGTELGRYRTYAWGPASALSTGDPRLDNNEFFDRRVRERIQKALTAKGFEQATADPDVLVHYHASVTQRIDPSELDPASPQCEDANCHPFLFDSGTLFIDLIDARTDRLAWRGWAEGSVDGLIDNQEWIEARVDEAVAKILERLTR